jgi:hypothetical protein
MKIIFVILFPLASFSSFSQSLTLNNVNKSDSFINATQINGKVLFEIPKTVLGREILIRSIIISGSAGMKRKEGLIGIKDDLGFAGDVVNEIIVRFEEGKHGKIYLTKRVDDNSAFISGNETSANLMNSIANSYVQPRVAAFDINQIFIGGESVIDVSELITGNNDLFYFNPDLKSQMGIEEGPNEGSSVNEIRQYSNSLEITSTKIYPKRPSPNKGESAVFQMQCSVILLPEVPMKGIIYNSRIGYLNRGSTFPTEYWYVNDSLQRITRNKFIIKQKIEPKDEDVSKYLKGELVEPKRPIVFYIDQLMPQKWIPYILAGVAEWNSAFELAGFKNAIVAKLSPKNDSGFVFYDNQHNTITYRPSLIENAVGFSTQDPRSGEILYSNILINHPVDKIFYNPLMSTVGAVDPAARTIEADDVVQGKTLQCLVAHEVGHTLGLAHNMGASSTIPTDSLRSKRWLQKTG